MQRRASYQYTAATPTPFRNPGGEQLQIKISDYAECHKTQNRIAQRNYHKSCDRSYRNKPKKRFENLKGLATSECASSVQKPVELQQPFHSQVRLPPLSYSTYPAPDSVSYTAADVSTTMTPEMSRYPPSFPPLLTAYPKIANSPMDSINSGCCGDDEISPFGVHYAKIAGMTELVSAGYLFECPSTVKFLLVLTSILHQLASFYMNELANQLGSEEHDLLDSWGVKPFKQASPSSPSNAMSPWSAATSHASNYNEKKNIVNVGSSRRKERAGQCEISRLCSSAENERWSLLGVIARHYIQLDIRLNQTSLRQRTYQLFIMKLFYTLSLSTAMLMAAVSSLPTTEDSITEFPLETLPFIPDLPEGSPPVVFNADGSVLTRRQVSRSIGVDVYYDPNGGGRHEKLWVFDNGCFDLGNGWDDQITSLNVPGDVGCNFYR
ncbi:uncharacterized protein BDR25DRAFT_348802 [Lindgomyces ingoldianus]|uniref:Uncharacterized protein n=1 Tax=Lindgomyces ingoldianus TaxID=673940 RepID=A0ACB6RC36_9PLEO|nr:uncharacterized protein BDR25DRAFT_348802 [Lindgomyces ingoldianus]KAF2476868.1 hypothetical protein BDR25DRAFT_348802 [Lindgomyces ingoldianus]